MPETVVIQPDAEFIKDVIASGGGDLKKCFQCATCSVVCDLSPEDAPFPRKQMIEAQWGLKDKVTSDPALWLCHNCGNCTTQCPRGARPGDVFGALRQQAIKHFAFPAFMGKLVAQPAALLLIYLVAALVFTAVALWAPKEEHVPQLAFGNVFPVPIMEYVFFAVSGIVALCFAVGLARFIRALRASGATGPILTGLIPAMKDIAAHKSLSTCSAEKTRRTGHLLTLYSFVWLATVSTILGFGVMFDIKSLLTPLPILSFWKILANIGALVIVTGCTMLLADRSNRSNSTYFDWFFLLTLSGVAYTGVLSELARLAQLATGMYVIYFAHLILVFSLFVCAPYSKFAHFLYRTVAMAASSTRK